MTDFDIWNPQASDDRWIRAWRWLCGLATLVFLLMQLMGGVVRWVLDMLGAAVLAYLPNVLMWACIGFVVVYDLLMQRLRPSAMGFMALVLLSMVVGYTNTHSLTQVVFGLWVLTPFLFGLTVAPALLLRPQQSMVLLYVLAGIAVGGVVLHSTTPLPWVGLSYSVGGVEVEGAREWQTSGGNQRLSGFARSSFDVAGQIIVVAALLSLRLARAWQRVLLWALCGYAVSLATSKGILLALLMTVVASEALLRQRPKLLVMPYIVGIIWLFVPPILGWTMDWSKAAHTDLDNPLYGSFIDRMNDMWPRALALATDYGLPLLGRGMGGIGVAVSIYEPQLTNAGDNVFVYCAVLIGTLVVPLFALGFAMLIRLGLHLPSYQRQDLQTVLLLAVIINWYGAVSNILEHAVLALAMGMVCRYLAVHFGGKDWSSPPEPHEPQSVQASEPASSTASGPSL